MIKARINVCAKKKLQKISFSWKKKVDLSEDKWEYIEESVHDSEIKLEDMMEHCSMG